MEPAIQVENLSKSFGAKKALNAVSITVSQGEMVGFLGASGSGKSTLLRHLSGLTAADVGSGPIRILGKVLQENGVLAADVRRQRSRIALIFQQFNLVDRLPVMTNVLAGALHRHSLLKTLFRKFPQIEYISAWNALCRVGIEQCAWQRASTLSGGQQQRAAISRAIVQGAQIVLADEPIASLDPESSRKVLELLSELNREQRKTILVSLHQVEYAREFCPRIIALRDGEIVFDGPREGLTDEVLNELYGGTALISEQKNTPPKSEQTPRHAIAA